MSYCRHCGEEVSEPDEHCAYCGEQWDVNTVKHTTAPDGVGQAVTTTAAVAQRGQYTRPDTRLPTMKEDVILRRTGAVVIDSVLVLVIATIVASILPADESTFALTLLFYPVYFALAEAKTGQTPGKAAVDLTVISTQGTTISTKQAVIRNILRYVDMLFYYLLGLIIILASNRNQRLGDVVANTVVVRDSAVTDRQNGGK